MSAFLSIVGLGFIFFASPGPINFETVRRGVNNGPWSAFCVQIGAVLAELALGGVVLLGLAPLMRRLDVQLAFSLLSAGVLLWIAGVALRDAGRARAGPSQSRASRNSLFVGMVYAASSPFTPMLWLSIAGVAAAHGVAMTNPFNISLVGCGYLVGALAWAVLVAAIVGWGRAVVQPRVWRYWNAASGIIVGAYGVHLLWQLV